MFRVTTVRPCSSATAAMARSIPLLPKERNRSRRSLRHLSGACAVPTTRPYRADTSEFDVPWSKGLAFELTIVRRHRQQKVRETRRCDAVQSLQACILVGIHDDHRGLAMPGDGLNLLAGRFDYRTEVVLGFLHRPCRHDAPILARKSVQNLIPSPCSVKPARHPSPLPTLQPKTDPKGLTPPISHLFGWGFSHS